MRTPFKCFSWLGTTIYTPGFEYDYRGALREIYHPRALPLPPRPPPTPSQGPGRGGPPAHRPSAPAAAWRAARPGLDSTSQGFGRLPQLGRPAEFGSKPMGSHFGIGEFSTHLRAYFSGDWDVHWGYGVLTHGQVGSVWRASRPEVGFLKVQSDILTMTF